ncbi:MAG TPA: DNA cytosine methyltransferase [Kiritimatiellia bacterium]|nr:DNA cytosine methyltransferase [Kiritimatiellia bacterium]
MATKPVGALLIVESDMQGGVGGQAEQNERSEIAAMCGMTPSCPSGAVSVVNGSPREIFMLKPSFVSIYSGCGGLDLGFLQAGYRCLGAFDVDPCAISTHKRNMPSIPAHIVDLYEFKITDVIKSNPDVLVSSPPCQGFSTAGRRRLNDPRNLHVHISSDIALALKPTVFLLENVRGILAPPHDRHWQKLIASLRRGGYKTKELLCDASHHGIAQMRKRTVLVAWTGSANPEFNLEILPKLTIRDALKGINGATNNDAQFLRRGSVEDIIAGRIKPGQKLSNVRGGAASVHTWDIPEVYGRITAHERTVLEAVRLLRRRNRARAAGDADPVSAIAIREELKMPVHHLLSKLIAKRYLKKVGREYDLTHTFNGKYKRLDWDGVSYTVDTRFGDPKYFLHPDENRGLTVREAARIQGFPDTFEFQGSEKHQYMQVGNAVPPPLALCLAEHIKRHLLSKGATGK